MLDIVELLGATESRRDVVARVRICSVGSLPMPREASVVGAVIISRNVMRPRDRDRARFSMK